MKIPVTRLLILLGIAVVFCNCLPGIERDARRLAALQKQKTAIVIEMLAQRDSLAKAKLDQELTIIEFKYNKMNNHMMAKYGDSLNRIHFQNAYNQALIHYK